MASVMQKRDMAKAAPGHEKALPLMQAGQDGERESADRRRYGPAQNSWTRLDTVYAVQGMGARST